jgi:DNA-binding response OmpR family regulator
MPTILLVDDEPLVRKELGGLLEDEGYTVLSAEDGEEGLEAFRRHRPDMVITDARMPRREGLSLARAILEEDAHVPITMITGHGSEAMAVEALRLGMTDFIKKPVQLPDLLAALDRMRGALRATKERLDPASTLPPPVQLVSSTHRYTVGNDIGAIPDFVSVVVREIAPALDSRRRDALHLALREILLNAVEHGNLGVTYEEKTEATERGTLEALLADRASEPRLRGRRVRVEATRTPERISIVVEDEGAGFDWRSLPDPTDPENLLIAHGRGVLLANLSVDELAFNEAGNCVTLVANVVPPAQRS